MSAVALAILTGVLMGIVFGFALEKSRVFEPGIIVGQMQLRNFIMLKVFLSAVATGAVVLAALNGFGYVKLQPKAALYAADLVEWLATMLLRGRPGGERREGEPTEAGRRAGKERSTRRAKRRV